MKSTECLRRDPATYKMTKSIIDVMFAMYHAERAYGAGSPDHSAAVREYNLVVAALDRRLGPQAHCKDVDPELHSLYRDVCSAHDDEPCGGVTLREAETYLNAVALKGMVSVAKDNARLRGKLKSRATAPA